MQLKEFRTQYPEYDDMSDEDLSRGLHEKYYSDIPFEDFSKEFGYDPERTPGETDPQTGFSSDDPWGTWIQTGHEPLDYTAPDKSGNIPELTLDRTGKVIKASAGAGVGDFYQSEIAEAEKTRDLAKSDDEGKQVRAWMRLKDAERMNFHFFLKDAEKKNGDKLTHEEQTALRDIYIIGLKTEELKGFTNLIKDLPPMPSGSSGFIETGAKGFSRHGLSMAITMANPPGGSVIMWKSLYGAKYGELVDEGIPKDVARNVAMVAALPEALIEQSSTILQIGRLKKLFKFTGGQKLSNKFVEFLVTVFKNAGTEGAEEYFQNYPNQIANIYARYRNKSAKEIAGKVLEEIPRIHEEGKKEAVVGFAVGGFLPVAAEVAAGPLNVIRSKQNKRAKALAKLHEAIENSDLSDKAKSDALDVLDTKVDQVEKRNVDEMIKNENLKDEEALASDKEKLQNIKELRSITATNIRKETDEGKLDKIIRVYEGVDNFNRNDQARLKAAIEQKASILEKKLADKKKTDTGKIVPTQPQKTKASAPTAKKTLSAADKKLLADRKAAKKTTKKLPPQNVNKVDATPDRVDELADQAYAEEISPLPESKAPQDMTEKEYVAELKKIDKATTKAEKTPGRKMTPDEVELWQKDWEAYSRARGYSEKEIAQWKRWLEIAPPNPPQSYDSDSDMYQDMLAAKKGQVEEQKESLPPHLNKTNLVRQGQTRRIDKPWIGAVFSRLGRFVNSGNRSEEFNNDLLTSFKEEDVFFGLGLTRADKLEELIYSGEWKYSFILNKLLDSGIPISISLRDIQDRNSDGEYVNDVTRGSLLTYYKMGSQQTPSDITAFEISLNVSLMGQDPSFEYSEATLVHELIHALYRLNIGGGSTQTAQALYTEISNIWKSIPVENRAKWHAYAHEYVWHDGDPLHQRRWSGYSTHQKETFKAWATLLGSIEGGTIPATDGRWEEVMTQLLSRPEIAQELRSIQSKNQTTGMIETIYNQILRLILFFSKVPKFYSVADELVDACNKHVGAHFIDFQEEGAKSEAGESSFELDITNKAGFPKGSSKLQAALIDSDTDRVWTSPLGHWDINGAPSNSLDGFAAVDDGGTVLDYYTRGEALRLVKGDDRVDLAPDQEELTAEDLGYDINREIEVMKDDDTTRYHKNTSIPAVQQALDNGKLREAQVIIRQTNLDKHPIGKNLVKKVNDAAKKFDKMSPEELQGYAPFRDFMEEYKPVPIPKQFKRKKRLSAADKALLVARREANNGMTPREGWAFVANENKKRSVQYIAKWGEVSRYDKLEPGKGIGTKGTRALEKEETRVRNELRKENNSESKIRYYETRLHSIRLRHESIAMARLLKQQEAENRLVEDAGKNKKAQEAFFKKEYKLRIKEDAHYSEVTFARNKLIELMGIENFAAWSGEKIGAATVGQKALPKKLTGPVNRDLTKDELQALRDAGFRENEIKDRGKYGLYESSVQTAMEGKVFSGSELVPVTDKMIEDSKIGLQQEIDNRQRVLDKMAGMEDKEIDGVFVQRHDILGSDARARGRKEVTDLLNTQVKYAQRRVDRYTRQQARSKPEVKVTVVPEFTEEDAQERDKTPEHVVAENVQEARKKFDTVMSVVRNKYIAKGRNAPTKLIDEATMAIEEAKVYDIIDETEKQALIEELVVAMVGNNTSFEREANYERQPTSINSKRNFEHGKEYKGTSWYDPFTDEIAVSARIGSVKPGTHQVNTFTPVYEGIVLKKGRKLKKGEFASGGRKEGDVAWPSDMVHRTPKSRTVRIHDYWVEYKNNNGKWYEVSRFKTMGEAQEFMRKNYTPDIPTPQTIHRDDNGGKDPIQKIFNKNSPREVIFDAYYAPSDGYVPSGYSFTIVDRKSSAYGASFAVPDLSKKTLAAKIKEAEALRTVTEEQKESEPFKFSDPKMQKQATAAEGGYQTPGWYTKFLKWLREDFRTYFREFKYLKRKDYGELQFQLRQLKKGQTISANETAKLLAENIDALNKDELRTFTKLAYMMDFYEQVQMNEAARAKGDKVAVEEFPFGWTEAVIKTETRRLWTHAQANEAVMRAWHNRLDMWRALRVEYKAAMDDVGFDVGKKLNRTFYFRHQILDILKAQHERYGSRGSGGKLAVPTRRSHLRKRKGGEQDINLNYIQAEFEVMAQMRYDTKIAATLAAIMEKYGSKTEPDNSEGYVPYNPREDTVFFMANSVPGKIVENSILAGLEDINVPIKKLNRVLAMGGRYKDWWLPKEIAATLDTALEKPRRGPVTNALKNGMRGWKMWQLLSPYRALKYNIRNLTGDVEAMWVGDPKTFAYIKKATADLWEWRINGNISADLQDWLDRGGSETVLQSQEMGQLLRDPLFRKHVTGEKFKAIDLVKIPARKVRAWTDMREILLRYAAYKRYSALFKRQAKPNNYAASMPEEVDSLSDPRDKAFLMSNDLLGAYDRISIFGEHLRTFHMPFWSFQEINMKRTVQFVRNAVRNDDLMMTIGRKLGAKGVMAPLKLGKFVFMMGTMSAMMQVWNYFAFGDEEDALPDEMHRRPHIIYGRNKDDIYYFPRIGILGDLLEWAGLDTAPTDITDFLSKKKTMREIIDEYNYGFENATDVLNKIIQSGGPQYKVLIEMLGNKKLFPNIKSGQPITDRTRYAFEQLQLEGFYDLVAGKPTKKSAKMDLLTKMLPIYKGDIKRFGWLATQQKVHEYLKKSGKGGSGFIVTKSGNALYNLGVAWRYGDEKAIAKYLFEYVDIKTQHFKFDIDIMGAMEDQWEKLDPLSKLGDTDGVHYKMFMASLNDRDLHALGLAYQYYLEIKAGVQFLEDK